MNNKILILIVSIIIIFVASGYFINKSKIEQRDENARNQALEEINTKPKITLDVKYQYKDGKHIYVGLISAPTPCHTISKNVTQKGNDYFVNLNIADPSPDTMCAQVISDRPFYVEFEAPQNTPTYFRLNNEEVNLNIFEIPSDKEIENVEIYIKG